APRGPSRKPAAQPGWMPDPGLLRAMKPHAASAAAEPRPARGRGGVVDPQAQREADRYENPIPSREAILQVLADADGPLDAEALQAVLGLDDPERAAALDKRLAAMLRDGQVLKNRRGGFVDRKSTRLNSSHVKISYAVFCL